MFSVEISNTQGKHSENKLSFLHTRFQKIQFKWKQKNVLRNILGIVYIYDNTKANS